MLFFQPVGYNGMYMTLQYDMETFFHWVWTMIFRQLCHAWRWLIWKVRHVGVRGCAPKHGKKEVKPGDAVARLVAKAQKILQVPCVDDQIEGEKTGFPGLLFWKEELGQTWYDGDLFIDDFEWCWSMLIYFDLFCSIFMVVAGCFCYKATRCSILWWSTWSKTTISRETAGGHASLAGFPPRTGSSDLGARGQAAASQLMFVVTRGDLHF